ncbi:hypothetical protein ACVW1C_005790 [Bradyrhizobium sp. USDA 4011]
MAFKIAQAQRTGLDQIRCSHQPQPKAGSTSQVVGRSSRTKKNVAKASNTPRSICVDGMKATIGQSWYRVCRQVGVSKRECELIHSAFPPEGFSYKAPTIATDDVEELLTIRPR